MQAGFTLAHPIFIVVAAGTLVCVFLRGAVHKFFDGFRISSLNTASCRQVLLCRLPGC